MEFKISVVVPCYNVEQYIDRCADSILNQTIGIENLQVIFVNDASPDRVEEHLLRYEQQYPDNICVINLEENGGLSNARNVGMQYAMAEYISFIDSDDWIEPDMYEKMYQIAVQKDCDIVICDSDKCESQEKSTRNRTQEDEFFILDSVENRKDFLKRYRIDIAAWNKLYRLSLFTEHNIDYPQGLLYEDGYTTMMLFMLADKIYFLREVLYHWFVNGSGITQNCKRISDRISVQVLLLERIKTEGLYDDYKEEIDYNCYEKLFAETIFLLTVNHALTIELVNDMKHIVLQLIPDITKNIYYSGKEVIVLLDCLFISRLIMERQVDADLLKRLDRKFIRCCLNKKIDEFMNVLWLIKEALHYLESGDDQLYNEIADCYITMIEEIGTNLDFTMEEDEKVVQELIYCFLHKSRDIDKIKNYINCLEDIITDGALNAAVYGVGYTTSDVISKYYPGHVVVDTNSDKIGSRLDSFLIEDIDTVIKQVNCIIIGDIYYQTYLEEHLKLKYPDKKMKIINPFRSFGFYPTEEIICDNYAERNVFSSEEDFNQMNEQCCKKGPVNAFVDEVFENIPLFREVEIETVNRCNGTCEFCPVNKHADTREYHFMEEELYHNIIDQLAQINYSGQIAPFSNNEPFLDDRIIERTKYMREKLPNARIHLYTNGTLLSIEKFQSIIEYIDELIIDNYHPEHKLLKTSQAIKEYCELNPNLKKKVTIVIRDPKEILTSRGGDAPNRKDLRSFPECKCALPYQQLIIRPDGKVSLCCNDPLGKNTLGDLTKESILDVWYGEKYNQIRTALQNGRKGWKHCEFCDTFYIY